MKLQMDFSLVSKLVIMSDCDWCNAEMEPGRPGNESPGRRVNILGRDGLQKMDLINIMRQVKSGVYLLQNTTPKNRNFSRNAGTHSEILSMTAETSSMVLLAVVFAALSYYK